MADLIKIICTAIVAYLSVLTFAASASFVPQLSVAIVSAILFASACKMSVLLFYIFYNAYKFNYLIKLAEHLGRDKAIELHNDIGSISKDFKPVFKLNDNFGWGMNCEDQISIDISIFIVSKEGARYRYLNVNCESFGYTIVNSENNAKKAVVNFVYYGDVNINDSVFNTSNSDFIEVVISNGIAEKIIKLASPSANLNVIKSSLLKSNRINETYSYGSIVGPISR